MAGKMVKRAPGELVVVTTANGERIEVEVLQIHHTGKWAMLQVRASLATTIRTKGRLVPS